VLVLLLAPWPVLLLELLSAVIKLSAMIKM
jgi:hypothetical protein